MSYYLPLGDGAYQPTIHSQGAWSEHEQHMAPVSGLLTRALEAHEPREELQIGKVTFDILGMIHRSESTVSTRTLRPGRTIELVEATLSSGGRDVVRATAWRLSTQDTAPVAGSTSEPMPGPDGLGRWDGTDIWAGGYIRSVQFRPVGTPEPGRARVWLRTEHPLVQGQESSPLARFVGLVDTANGIATRQSPREWMYPNTDLTVHFHRTPTGPWVGLDTRVSWGPTGLGVTASTLHDVEGPVGHALQVLTVRPMPTPTP